MNARDCLFAEKDTPTTPFVFDEAVANVFPDMINRSVPGYAQTLAMIGLIAARWATPGSRIYDLGCSLGAASLAMRPRLQGRGCRILAVDNSKAMTERLRVLLEKDVSKQQDVPVEVICQDIRETQVEEASLVILNFTLQFVPVADRQPLLERIAAGLRPGGALVLSEKIAFPGDDQALLDGLHYDYKRAHGYSDTEIYRKRMALENTLVPETLAAHEERLRRSGFSRIIPWQQSLQFVSFLALRPGPLPL
ncbi:MAG: carboxy-S-adenosyl-L-methionine synthase CmoA [Kistimonas sp.]|nr:carboxy-S-adenosyl-L-methionine synthase CmoA [Kistimonas sp.]